MTQLSEKVRCGDCKYFVRDGKCSFHQSAAGQDKSRPFAHAPFWVWSDCYSDREQAYALHLEARKHEGAVLWYKFEGMKFRLADGTFYTPDFIVLDRNGFMEAHEVKGFWTDDARVKIKVAADLYPVSFIAIKRLTKSKGGGWEVERFS